MKHNILSLNKLSILAIIALVFVACDKEEIFESAPEVTDHNGEYTYTMHLDCDAPLFDDEAGTRASYSWIDGSKLYLRFVKGTSTVSGTAVYNSSTKKWTVSATSSLNISNMSYTCYANYFKDSGTSTSTYVNLNPTTACYSGTGTYTHPTSSDIYLTVKLSPTTWRLRFYGSSGTSITVTNSSNIKYNTKFNISTGTYTTETKDVGLSAGSNGYTPYIYGIWDYSYIDNDVYVKNGSNTYSRGIQASNLKAKESAYMVIPTQSNYSSNGWKRESQYVSYCDLRTSYPFAFTDRLITGFDVGTNVAYCYMKVYKSSEISSLTESQIITKLQSDVTSRSVSEVTGNNWKFWGLSSNTDYVLCTYCTNSSGDHGNLVKYSFTTLSTTAPQAEISEVKYNNNYSEWYTYLTKLNNAYSYYLFCLQGTDWYNQETDWLAYDVRKAIAQGYGTVYYTWSPSYLTWDKTSNYITLISWARNYSGTIGNYYYFRGYASSSAPSLIQENMEKEETSGKGYDSMPRRDIPPYKPIEAVIVNLME